MNTKNIYRILTLWMCFITVNAFAQPIDRSKRPQPGPAPKVQIGKIERFELANGLKVFVVENHKLPKVSWSLQFDIDPFSQGDKKGFTDLFAELMATATATRSKNQINQEIDFIGGTLSFSSEGLYASSLKKHQDKLLELMSDVLLNPLFNQEELDKIKKQTISGLVSNENLPSAMAANIQGVLNYGKNHPYGEIITKQTIENVTLADCKGYYEVYFKPNVAYLAVVGDITLEEAKKMAEKYFGGWKRGNVPKNEVAGVKDPASTKVAFVPRPGAVQSSIRITYPVILKPGTDEAIKAKVMDEILGGGSSARLFMNLRETYNLTYGAYSDLNNDEHIGEFTAHAEVRTSGTDSAVNEFLKEINRLRTEKVTQKELQGVINNLTGKFAISLENPSTVAQFAINIDKYGMPKDYYETYLTKLAAVTVDDVYDMAQKFLRPDNAHIVIVGDRDKTQDLVKRWAGKIKFYDQYGNDFKEIKEAPKDLTGEKVIENYINAMGGADNIKKVKNVVMKMKGEMDAGGMTLNLEITSVRINPKKKGLVKSVEEVKMNGMVAQKKVFDGKTSKTTGMMGSSEATGEELEQEKEEAVPHEELRYKELGYTMTLVGIDEVEGTDAYKVELVNKKGKKTTQYFDTKTWLLVKTEKKESSPQGDVDIVSYSSDWKEVNGVKFPHKIKTEFGPQIMNLTVNSIEVNSSSAETYFK
ncbi:MAG: insulinase family protein [Bacteroidota bacterium]